MPRTETYQPVPVFPGSHKQTVPSSLAANVALGGVVAVSSVDADVIIREQNSSGNIIRRIPATDLTHAIGDSFECFNARSDSGLYLESAATEGELIFMVQFYD